MLCFGLGAMLILMHVYGSSWCVQIQLTELILFGFNSFLNVPHASLFLNKPGNTPAAHLPAILTIHYFVSQLPGPQCSYIRVIPRTHIFEMYSVFKWSLLPQHTNTSKKDKILQRPDNKNSKWLKSPNDILTAHGALCFHKETKGGTFPSKKNHTKTKTNPLGRHPSIFYSSRTYSKKAQNKLWYDSYLFHLLHFDCRLFVSALTSDFFIHHHSRPH